MTMIGCRLGSRANFEFRKLYRGCDNVNKNNYPNRNRHVGRAIIFFRFFASVNLRRR